MTTTDRKPSAFGPTLIVVALVFCGAAPVPVTAATVAVTEIESRSEMAFDAAVGEANAVSFAPAGQSAAQVTYKVIDTAAPLAAGPGCTGGGAPGTPAYCSMTPSRATSCTGAFCGDLGRRTVLIANLVDGPDSFDASAIPSGDGGGGEFRVSADGGDGADAIVTGAARDEIHPGPGADTVHAGPSLDYLVAESLPDGPDVFDLGPGGGELDWTGAQLPLQISIDGVADDGALGEGDNVIRATQIDGGHASDRIVGTDRDEILRGFEGADVIIAKGGDDDTQGGADADKIKAGPGDDQDFELSFSSADRYFGGPGDDIASGPAGDNLMKGGRGDDRLFGDTGDDRIVGGPGHDGLTGEPGADTLLGGTGPDRIGAGRDDDRDRIDCGPDTDRAHVGTGDHQRRCEIVRALD